MLVPALLLASCSNLTFDGDTSGEDGSDRAASPTGDASAATVDAGEGEGEGGSGGGQGPVTSSSASAAATIPLGDVCGRLPGLPFAERRQLLSAQPAGPAAATSECPEELMAVERLEEVAARSALLDDDGWFDAALTEWDCTDRGLTAVVRNPFDFPIRLIVVTQLVSATTGDIVGTGWTVTPPVEPGASERVTVDYVPSPVQLPELSCNLSAQAFLALDGDAAAELTDTWDAGLGLADPPPDTTGDDWEQLLPLILEAEQEVEASGDWPLAATYEDVRSKNYRALVDGTVDSSAVDFAVLDVCTVQQIDDRLVAVTWHQEGPGGRGVVLGVFHRSAIDDRWRWVHTGIFLSGIGADCQLVRPPTA